MKKSDYKKILDETTYTCEVKWCSEYASYENILWSKELLKRQYNNEPMCLCTKHYEELEKE